METNLRGRFKLRKNQTEQDILNQQDMYPGESNDKNPPLQNLSESEKKKLQVKDGQNNLNVDERGGF